MMHAGYHHAGGMVGWMLQMVLGSLIHALVFGLVFKVMRELTLPEAVLLVAVVLAALLVWARARDRRGRFW
jgi:uncharacterized membrane protein (UPF0136 family)